MRTFILAAIPGNYTSIYTFLQTGLDGRLIYSTRILDFRWRVLLLFPGFRSDLKDGLSGWVGVLKLVRVGEGRHLYDQRWATAT